MLDENTERRKVREWAEKQMDVVTEPSVPENLTRGNYWEPRGNAAGAERPGSVINHVQEQNVEGDTGKS